MDWDAEYTEQWQKMLQVIALDDKTVIMPQSVFRDLLEYSSSLPSGVYSNKVWKRFQQPYERTEKFPAEWYMGQYGPPVNERCPILWREIIVI